MKKYTLLMISACLFNSFAGIAQAPVPEVNIIPKPASIRPGNGEFRFSAKTQLVYNAPELKSMAEEAAGTIKWITGNDLEIRNITGTSPARRAVSLILDAGLQIPAEGYNLSVTNDGIVLRGSTSQGLFYGVRSLIQLIPGERDPRVPGMTIDDAPRFGWRGLLLDVSRHFFTIAEVKKMIDEMVLYKFNLLHLHLSDDQGWRVEIKSLPELTKTGAWRVPRTGLWWDRECAQPGEKATYGGFYTQDEIRDLVAYAKERHVDILPEIDVPGHSLAAIASYPWLSSTQLNYTVNPGCKFYTIEDNSLCAGRETTYEFLDKVFTEIAQLFPFEYIHIGGDECYKGFWKNCPECQKRMQDNHLKDLDELQSYFIKRVEKILESKGKKLMGWDEILEGGLAPNASVMSWRGMKGGIEAAKSGHKVVMSPTTWCYLDLYQGDPAIEPPTYSMLRLKTVYEFEPVPEGVDPALILGGQGNLWSESVPTWRHAEYMLWPRSLALAEALWSPAGNRDWTDFVRRTELHVSWLGKADINTAVSFRDAIIKTSKDTNGNLLISLDTEVDGLQLYYSFDNTYPDAHSPMYKTGEKLSIPKDADTYRVITFRDGKPYGRIITVPLADLAKRR